MRLGGFVIHGNAVGTLGDCLDSLRRVCDDVVAIDSFSIDGSSDLVRSRGIRTLLVRWQGYGAARAAAVKALAGCDYLFYLDSDEYLLPSALDEIQRWRERRPSAPIYRVRRRNWADFSRRRFLYRTDTRARLVRYDAASWKPQMIVHEALPPGSHPLTPVVIEHRFASDLERRVEKDDHYALLWAIRAFHEGKRPKPYWLERFAHLLRDLVVKGALFRGGMDAIRLAWAVSRYHAEKQRHLRSVLAGDHANLVADFQNERFANLFTDEERRPHGGRVSKS